MKPLQIGDKLAKLPLIQGGMGVESVSHVWPEPWLALAASASYPLPRLDFGKQISRKIQKLPICVLWWQN